MVGGAGGYALFALSPDKLCRHAQVGKAVNPVAIALCQLALVRQTHKSAQPHNPIVLSGHRVPLCCACQCEPSHFACQSIHLLPVVQVMLLQCLLPPATNPVHRCCPYCALS
jgi:hypothetical protein